jgi:uncharacterized protein (DUF983 family)
MTEEREVSLKTAIRRAVLHRCPACGEGKLFTSYLKQVESCAGSQAHRTWVADLRVAWLRA